MGVTAHWLDDNFGTYDKCLTVTSFDVIQQQ